MGMDFGATQGVSRCRPYFDSAQEVWIRWYRAQPDALAFPGWTWSGSPLWERFRNRFEGPGVLFRGAVQRRPQVSIFDGDHFSGTLAQFADGLSIADIGPVANVCDLPLIASSGGVVIGGTAWGSATAIGGIRQAQRLTGRVSDQVDAVGRLSQAQGIGGTLCVGSRVSGTLSQSQATTGTIAVTVISSGQCAEASGATGSTSVVVSSAGTAVEASGASGSTSTATSVRGSLSQIQALSGRIAAGQAATGGLSQAQSLKGRSPTGSAVPGSLSQAQSLTGEVSGSSGPVNPITTDCVVCSGGTYTLWTVTLSGITGNADCVAQNGTWTITHVPGVCTWEIGYPASFFRRVQLLLIPGGNATLTWMDMSGTPQAVYTLPTSSWSCLGTSNTLSLASSPQCAGWPATITLTSS